MYQHHPGLYIAQSPLGGRGVFTASPIPAGSLIEICPVIVLSAEDLALIHKTHLHDYYFLWEEPEGAGALAMGYGSLYNHSAQPNAHYTMDTAWQTIDIMCIRDIPAGEEITLNYNGDPDDRSRVWFEE